MPTGDPDVNIPPLDPLKIGDVNTNVNEKKLIMILKLDNLVLTGLSNFEVSDLNADLGTFILKTKVFFPSLMISGMYNVSGKAMKFIPIYGNGKAIIQVDNFKIDAVITIKLDLNDGKLQLLDFKMNLEFAKSQIYLENILGGGSLGDLVNMAVNSLGKPLFDKNKDKIEDSIRTIVTKLLNKELSHVDIRNIIHFSPMLSNSYVAYSDVILPDRNNVNAYVDQLLRNLKENPKEFDPLTIQGSSKKVHGIHVDIHNGVVHGLSSIHRIGDLVLKCDNKTGLCVLIGELGLKDITAHFNTHLKYHFVKMSPSIESKVSDIKVRFSLQINLNAGQEQTAHLISFSISSFSKPTFKIGKLGIFGKVLSFITNLIVPLVKNKIVNAIENPVKHALTEALKKVKF